MKQKTDTKMNIQDHSHIIYLIGKPGTGKYTIAQELAKSGFIVCDNQLINNPIFTLLNYDGLSKIPDFGWEAIGQIRKAVFAFMSVEHVHNYVLTNCLYENDGDRQCYSQVKSMALKRGSLFYPVKLLISDVENVRRIAEPSRRARWKSIDPQDVYQNDPLITVEDPHLLELDVSQLSPARAAEIILEHIKALPTSGTMKNAQSPNLNIQIIKATLDQQVIIAQLYELYTYEMTDLADFDIHDDGYFGYADLPLYWSDPNKTPYLVWVNQKLAGFVLIQKGSPIEADPDVWDIAEFFIMRKFRQKDIGQFVAHHIWTMHPGRWQIRVWDNNVTANLFWKNIIEKFSQKPAQGTKRAYQGHDGLLVYTFDSQGV